MLITIPEKYHEIDEAVVTYNGEFGVTHITQLLSYEEDVNHTMVSYIIAGGGLTNIVTAENIPAHALEQWHAPEATSGALLINLAWGRG